jgi:hypothetical protein
VQTMDPLTVVHLFGVSILHVDAMWVNHTADRYRVERNHSFAVCARGPLGTTISSIAKPGAL